MDTGYLSFLISIYLQNNNLMNKLELLEWE